MNNVVVIYVKKILNSLKRLKISPRSRLFIALGGLGAVCIVGVLAIKTMRGSTQTVTKPSEKTLLTEIFQPTPTITPTISSYIPSPTKGVKPTPRSTAQPVVGGSSSTSSTTSSSNSSGSQSNTTTGTSVFPVSTTPTPTPDTSGAFVSTNTLTLTMNRGETRNNLFTFTSTGATQFEITVNPSPSIPGMNWGPASGGISKGNTSSFFLTIPSNTPLGMYTGSIKLTFQPSNTVKMIALTLTVVEPSASDFGFTVSKDSVNATIRKGESQDVFSFTSTKATSFKNTVSLNPWISSLNWSPATGGINVGNTSTFSLMIPASAPVGTYTGTITIQDGNSGATRYLPLTLTVTD